MHKTFTSDNRKTNIEHIYDYNSVEASLVEDRSNFQKASTSGIVKIPETLIYDPWF